MINPERRQEVLEAICNAIARGNDWSMATDCFCVPLSHPPQWHYEFQEEYLKALCLNITAFTEAWLKERHKSEQPTCLNAAHGKEECPGYCLRDIACND